MSSDESTDRSRKSNEWPAESRLAGTTFFLANCLASLVPGLGGAVAEVIGRRREKRTRQFLEMTIDKIENIEQKLAIFSQPACIELLEEATEQACRGESNLKRTALARLIAASINDELVNHETDRLLLAILGELTDYELLHLLNFMDDGPYRIGNAFREYLDKSQEIVYPRANLDMAPQEDLDEYEVQQAHLRRLERLGLVIGNQDTTELGRLMLRRIGAMGCTD